MVVDNNALDGPSSLSMDIRPPNPNYTPSFWSDTFTSFSLDDQVQERYTREIEILKEEARGMLICVKDRNEKLVVLIDILERLGVAYHFEQEIEEQLHQIYAFHNSKTVEEEEGYDLFTTALQFRILRQHRFHVSCDVFKKYIGEDNKFKEAMISTDATGLLSLYEAAQVRLHGEDILEEAAYFCARLLNTMLPELESPHLAEQVKRAMELPLHKGVPRIEARFYIDIYEKNEAKNEMLLKLAKLDYNFLQNLYKKELSDLMRWWNEFKLELKLPYSRDRMVECYLWAIATYFQPQYSYARLAITRCVQLATTMDDTYDSYATLQEAQLFTDVLERWNIDEIGCLPEYMRVLYRFIVSMYEDFELEATKQGKSFAVPYAKESVKQIARAYNKDLKWFKGGLMPSYDEYMCNSYVTSTIFLVFTSIIPGIKSFSREATDWLVGDCNQMVIGVAIGGRCLNDLGSHKRESKEGKVPTGIEYYMNQHSVSKKEAIDRIHDLIESSWKDINAMWIAETSVPKEVLEGLLNYARAAEFTYKNSSDGFSNPEKYIMPTLHALFVDPLLI